jgi:hypothetical protein
MKEDIDVFIHFFQRLGEFPAIKIVAGLLIGMIRMMYGPMVRPAYCSVMMLWLADTATGYYYAWANPAIVPESRRLYHGLVKLCVYYFLLFLGYQCGQIILTAFLQGIIEGAIMLTEGYSILENIDSICVLKGIDIPILKAIIGKIKGKADELIK